MRKNAAASVTVSSPVSHGVNRISGLVAEYIVAIDVTRARFPADAFPVAGRAAVFCWVWPSGNLFLVCVVVRLVVRADPARHGCVAWRARLHQ